MGLGRVGYKYSIKTDSSGNVVYILRNELKILKQEKLTYNKAENSQLKKQNCNICFDEKVNTVFSHAGMYIYVFDKNR